MDMLEALSSLTLIIYGICMVSIVVPIPRNNLDPWFHILVFILGGAVIFSGLYLQFY